MSCYHPISGYMCQDGLFRPYYADPKIISYPMQVPCGGCVGCRIERSRESALRCMDEASLYSKNCLITLTYADEHVPKDFGLNSVHFGNFMKALRDKHVGCDSMSHPNFGQINKKTGRPYPEFYRPIRYYMCGEYGEKRERPHYHAILFNFDFPDKGSPDRSGLWPSDRCIWNSGRPWRETKRKHKVYRSQSLESLWPYGFSEIGNVTFQSCAYVARYIMKKVNGKKAEIEGTYDAFDPETGEYIYDPETGEICQRDPEFNHMSKKPGLGYFWLQKYFSDVYPRDYRIVNGRKCKVPRYYDKLLSRIDPLLYEEVKCGRHLRALSRLEDNTPERLFVKETVALEKVSRLKRSLT